MTDTIPFGRYRLLDRLGRGGMGTVYRAEDPGLGREVALKMLQVEGDEEAAERFRREAKAMAQLRHPNIVSVHDVGEEEGRHYFTMELVEGRDLDGVRLGVRRAAEAVRDAARGVQYAHEHGILHRDLKPGNLMEGAEGRVVVTDFGLAKGEAIGGGISRSEALIGTPAYMAPEQARGGRKVDARADVYGLGATLYALLTGRAPYHGDSAADVVMRVLEAEPTGVRRLRREVPGDLERVVGMAMAREAERRYATAGELADDLDRFLTGEPVQARPPSALYRLGKRLQKRKGFVAAVTGGAALVVLAASWLLPKVRETEKELKFREDLRPLEEAVKDAEPFFYIPGPDVHTKLEKVRTALEGLEEIAKDSERGNRSAVWRSIGMGWFFVGDLRKAEPALERARALSPGEAAVARTLGRLYLERSIEVQMINPSGVEAKQYAERAREAFATAAVTNVPGRPVLEDFLAQGYGALAEGKRTNVFEICDAALKEHGRKTGSEEFWYLRALGTEGVEGIEDADRLKTYDEALKLKPHFLSALFFRGSLKSRMGLKKEGIEDLDHALHLHPGHVYALLNRALARDALKDHDGAISDTTEAIRLVPGIPFAYLNRAASWGWKGEKEKGLRDLDEAHRLGCRDARLFLNRGTLRNEMGDVRGAKEDLEEAVRIDPRLPDGWNNLGLVRKQLGDREGALHCYSESLQCAPAHVRAWYNRGLLRYEMGNHRGALADYTEAIRLRSDDAVIFNNRALVRLALGETEGAQRDYAEALKLKPDYAEALANRSSLKFALQDYVGAVEDASASVRIQPEHSTGYYNRGCALAALDRHAEAEEDFTRVLRLRPGDPSAHFNRGNSRLRLGKTDPAIGDYSAALQRKPDWSEAYVQRGMARGGNGDVAGKIDDFEKALQAAPPGWSHRSAVERALKELKRRS